MGHAVPSPAPIELIPQSSYVHDLKPGLPPEVFRPARSRVLLVPLHVAIIAISTIAIAAGYLGFGAWALLASDLNPFFLVFIVPGVLLALSAIGPRSHGSS